MIAPNQLDAYESDEDFIFVKAAINLFDSDGAVKPNQETPDFSWPAIETVCRRLLEKGRDMRVLIWRIRANLAISSLEGLRETTNLLVAYLKAAPTEIRPFATDETSATDLHAQHLNWLSSTEFTHQLGNLQPPTLSAKLAKFAQGKCMTNSDYLGARQLGDDLGQIVANLLEAAETLKRRGTSLNVDPVVHMLNRVCSALNSAALAPIVARAHDGKPASEARASAMNSKTITSRQEVASTLEQISEYFRQHEPSHPAPLFLSRVQRMLGASFEEILSELYAEGPALAAQLGPPSASIK